VLRRRISEEKLQLLVIVGISIFGVAGVNFLGSWKDAHHYTTSGGVGG
jgi:hypothetical protein